MTSTTFTSDRWLQFWASYKGEPQQIAGVTELGERIAIAAPNLLAEDASWVANFHKAQPKPKVIKAPYFCQLQMDDGAGWRDCFSATCAMIAAWKGAVADENAYNHIRQRHGDSTVANAQIAALAELKLSAVYATNGTKARLTGLLDEGIPVGTGILHHGQASSPSGGGHWMLIVGYDEQGVIALDPYGELNVANGTWAHEGSGGDHVHYSWKNWLPRWEVAGGDGFMLWVA